MTYFKNKEIEIFRVCHKKIGIIVTNNGRKANKLNRMLDYYYPKGTNIKDDDEALFHIPIQNNYIRIQSALNMKVDLAALIEKMENHEKK